MSNNQNRSLSYIGRGTIYMRALLTDVVTSHVEIGNCNQFNLNFASEELEQKDYQNAGGGNAAKLTRVSNVTGAITTFTFKRNVLAAVLRAKINENAGGEAKTQNVTDVKALNAFIKLDEIPDKTQDITVAVDGGATLTVDKDYTVTNSGILLIESETPQVAIDDNLVINYTSYKSINVSPLTESQTNYEIVFDGLNEANDNKPVSVCIRCASIDVVQALTLISGDTEFGNLPFTFEALADETVTEDGLSKFAQILMTE